MSTRRTFKVWVSKFALYTGVRQVRVKPFGQSKKIVELVEFMLVCSYLTKGEWWLTKKLALKKAESMRKAKITALKRELRALENKRFT
jgi:hypothetical protein